MCLGEYTARTRCDACSAGFGRAKGVELRSAHGGNLRGSVFHSAENKSSADKGRKHGTDGVEGLGKIQAALRALRRAENRDVWIRGNFQKTLATGHHEQREKEKLIKA